MDLRETLVKALKEYREKHNLNTYQLRKLQPNNKPIGGVNVTTLNRIQNEPNFQPHRNTIKKLLNFLEIPFKEEFGVIKLTENDNSNRN